MTSSTRVKLQNRIVKNQIFLSQFCWLKMRAEKKSETILTKDNRFYFRKLPSKSRLSYSIIEIFADEDKRFLQKST